MDIRAQIVAEARTWVGTPYHHRASIKGAGVDCAMILIEVYSAVGLVAKFDPGEYVHDWMLHKSAEKYLEWVEQHSKRTNSPLPGDIAVWQFGRTFSHGSIVVDWPLVIHAHRRSRAVCYGDGSQGELTDRPVRFYTVVPQ